MTQKNKHSRMREEYNGQCQRLQEKQKAFRKIGRKQIQQRALRQKATTTPNENRSDIIKRGIKSLQMTPELHGLLRKINNTRRMLYMPEVTEQKLLRLL